MIKQIVNFWIFLLLTWSLSAQETTPLLVRANNGNLMVFEHVINDYVDSLNLWNTKLALPKFLLNKDFDFRSIFRVKRIECEKSDWSQSYRKHIFNRVYNQEVLEAIVESKDNRLDKKYDPKEHMSAPYDHRYPDIIGVKSPGPNILYMDYSTRELAMERLERLKELKLKFSRDKQ